LGYAGNVALHLELQSWDESRNVINAWEMQAGGDWIGVTYLGKLDDWNLKPPFGTWLIAICIKLFGFSEFAVRIPSLLFGTGTLLIVYFFLFNKTKNYFLSAFASLGLGSSVAFFGQHCWTTADYDVILVFFNTLSFIAVYKIVLEKSERWWIVLGISSGLAFMTKTLPGLLPVFFLLIGGVVTGSWSFLKNVKFILRSAALFLLITLPFFIAREALYEDHYIPRAASEDIVKRMTTVVEEHSGGWDYYITNMSYRFEEGYKFFYGASILFLLSFFIKKITMPAEQMREAGFILLCVVFYFAVFSVSTTKISWYTLPAYPLMLISVVYIVRYIPGGWYRVLAYPVSVLVIIFQLNRLLAHTSLWTTRNYEKVTKEIILPNKEELIGKKIFSSGEIMPSAVAYLQVFSEGQYFPVNRESVEKITIPAGEEAFLLTADEEERPALEVMLRAGSFILYKIE
jgi:4-amino-4-deoxy-L-arabinose transferase-like glycosyltransferase